jgi:hypothetical protein
MISSRSFGHWATIAQFTSAHPELCRRKIVKAIAMREVSFGPPRLYPHQVCTLNEQGRYVISMRDERGMIRNAPKCLSRIVPIVTG